MQQKERILLLAGAGSLDNFRLFVMSVQKVLRASGKCPLGAFTFMWFLKQIIYTIFAARKTS